MNNKFFAVHSLSLIAALAIAAQAHAGDVVVVMGTGGAALTKDQVAGVYLGRSNDFKPVDLPESSPVREAFYKKATDRDPSQVKAVWSRLAFSGQATPPKEMADAAAVKKAVAADPKAVGYIDKADVDASVKVVLSLN
jgi:ABC-type phosphate transport system substrate-binding protein